MSHSSGKSMPMRVTAEAEIVNANQQRLHASNLTLANTSPQAN